MGTGWEESLSLAGVAREEGHMGVKSAERKREREREREGVGGRSTEEKGDGRSQTEHKMGRREMLLKRGK